MELIHIIYMTKKIDAKSETKQRIRQYLKEIGVDLRTAEKKSGFKPGYLSAGGVVGSDKLSLFVKAFPSADLFYLVTGLPDPMRSELSEIVKRMETYLETTK